MSVRILYCLALSVLFFISARVLANTEVRIQTNLGNIDIVLFDDTTPDTVDNFLEYVVAGTYSDSISHRYINNFMFQAGGFKATADPLLIEPLGAFGAVVNEPRWSNTKGTIAMAKIGGNPNSATNQWFINLNDNSPNLDVQNGGFTVFGAVLADSIAVIDAINQLPDLPNLLELGAPFDESQFGDVPLLDYTLEEFESDPPAQVTYSNLLVIEDVFVINDVSLNTADTMGMTENTLIIE